VPLMLFYIPVSCNFHQKPRNALKK